MQSLAWIVDIVIADFVRFRCNWSLNDLMTQCHPVAATLSQPSLKIDSPIDQERRLKTKIASMVMAIAAMTAAAPAHAEKKDIEQLAE